MFSEGKNTRLVESAQQLRILENVSCNVPPKLLISQGFHCVKIEHSEKSVKNNNYKKSFFFCKKYLEFFKSCSINRKFFIFKGS